MSLLRLILSGCLVAVALPALASETFAPAPELWDRPRTARAVLEQPAIRGAVGAYLAHDGARMVIHHPPGTGPALQAEELRAWLTALAVDSQHVALASDPSLKALTIEVTAGP